jgi:hypothetical protein
MIRLTSVFLHLFIGALTTCFAFAGAADEFFHSSPNARLKEGVFTNRGPRNILGEGVDTVVTLRKKRNTWFISYRYIRHFSVNVQKPPEDTTAGPFAVKAVGPVLEYQGPHGVEKISYRFDGTSLVMPAVVRLDARTWMCQTTEILRDPSKKRLVTRPQKYVWRCQADPTSTPQGEAEFPPFGSVAGESKGQYTYVFSQEKDTASRTISVLRFLNASKDKKNATESCRLTWDAEGAIRFDARSVPRIHQLKYSPAAPSK